MYCLVRTLYQVVPRTLRTREFWCVRTHQYLHTKWVAEILGKSQWLFFSARATARQQHQSREGTLLVKVVVEICSNKKESKNNNKEL